MEPELLVCSSSYAEWINQVENDNSASDYNSIDDLMEGVGSSVNHLDLPVIIPPDVVLNSNLQTDSLQAQVEVEVEVHPPPSTSNRGRGKGSRGGGEAANHVEVDGKVIVDEVHVPPNQS